MAQGTKNRVTARTGTVSLSGGRRDQLAVEEDIDIEAEGEGKDNEDADHEHQLEGKTLI